MSALSVARNKRAPLYLLRKIHFVHFASIHSRRFPLRTEKLLRGDVELQCNLNKVASYFHEKGDALKTAFRFYRRPWCIKWLWEGRKENVQQAKTTKVEWAGKKTTTNKQTDKQTKATSNGLWRFFSPSIMSVRELPPYLLCRYGIPIKTTEEPFFGLGTFFSSLEHEPLKKKSGNSKINPIFATETNKQ